MNKINTHNLKVDFGRHRGELYTRIPVNYLLWMVQVEHDKSEIAEAELKRRGTTLPTVDISGHAIDSASLRLRRTWHETTRENEGLYSWLVRISEKALKIHKPDKKGRIIYKNIKFVFEFEGRWPVLKTIMPYNKERVK